MSSPEKRDDLQATIEELRAVNEELQATNEELRTALDDVARLHGRLTQLSELAFDGILVVDARSLAVLEANRAATLLFGLPAHELTRSSLPTLVVPSDAQALLEAVAQVSRGGGKSTFLRMRGTGEKGVPVRLAIAPVDFDHTPLLHCTLQDLSDRSQLKEQLSATQGVLRSVFDALPVGLLVLSRDGTSDEGNARLAQITGIAEPPKRVLARLGAEWPGFERAVEDAWRGATTSLRGSLRTAEGATEVYARVFPVVAPDATIDRLGVVLEDRSSETALQRRMSAIFDAIDDAVVVTDASERVVAWNAGAERIYGYPFASAIGARVEDLLRPMQPLAGSPLPPAPAPAATTGRVMHRHREGTPVEVDFVVRALVGAGGSVEGRVAVYRPRRVAVDLDVQLLRAERLHGLGTLAAGIAHEFNNMLGAVLANCSYLTAQLQDEPELLSAVGAMTDSARRGADLTRQMLALAQGRSESEAAADVRAVLRSVARLVGTGQSDLDVRVDLPPGPLLARADSAQLRQCILNLAINARDAMREHGVLRLTAEHGSDTVLLHVDDSGPGVPEALRTQIFDPFFTTKAPGEGTGLGLALVHALVERWHGSITVVTSPLGGARFSLTVPRMHAKPSERPSPSPAATEAPRLALVIDDEPAVRAGTARLLRMLGIEALVASRGEEGLSILATTRVDLVLIDVVMPDMHGDEVYRRLRTTQPALPVLFVSGYAADRLGNVLDEDPNVRFLGKPFDVQALAAEVSTLLGTPRLDADG